MADATSDKWVSTWASTPASVDDRTLDGQTIRMIARVSIGGKTLRVRLSNACSLQKLRIGGVHIAQHTKGAGIDPNTDRPLTFNGAVETTIGVGALIVSDPIKFDLEPLADLVISVFIPDRLEDGSQITGHGNSRQTSFLSPNGNFVSAAQIPDAEATEDILFLNGIDVLATATTGGIVTMGDSLTDCNLSTVDANNRWPDELARRLQARYRQEGGRQLSVINQGIGGNRVLHDTRGDSCLRRFDRDVIAQPGVTHAIVCLGINDIRNRFKKPGEEVTAQQMISGYAQLATRGQAAGITMYIGTLLAYEGENYNPPPGLTGLYTEEGNATRLEINDWIRSQNLYDGIIDFDVALRDPDHPNRILPVYDCGDHLHPGDEGYLRMGQFVDLSLFD